MHEYIFSEDLLNTQVEEHLIYFFEGVLKLHLFLAKVLMAHLLECEMAHDSSWGKYINHRKGIVD